MIVKSQFKLEVGKKYGNGDGTYVVDQDGKPRDIPYIVLKEVTRKDYVEYWTAMNGILGQMLPNDKYYRVSAD